MDEKQVIDAVEKALRNYAEGKIPFAWAALVVSGLFTASSALVGALWHYATKKNEQLFAQLEAIRKEQKADAAESSSACEAKIAKLREDHKETLERVLASKRLVEQQFREYEREQQQFMIAHSVAFKDTLREANEINEAALGVLEKLAKRE